MDRGQVAPPETELLLVGRLLLAQPPPQVALVGGAELQQVETTGHGVAAPVGHSYTGTHTGESKVKLASILILMELNRANPL